MILVYSYCVLILEVEVAHTITMLEKKYTAFRNKAVSIKKELIRYFDQKPLRRLCYPIMVPIGESSNNSARYICK